MQQFERTHSFVDARHVGNFGHSYGGFMTMHMATRTNIFATSISIAGISNIAEYWGGGWTGYSYTEGHLSGLLSLEPQGRIHRPVAALPG